MTEYKLKDLISKYLKLTDKYSLNDFINICSNYLNKDKNYILTSIDVLILDEKQFNELENLFYKLVKMNIPYQYIIGYKDFYNERYIVNNSVLIPREDTEILVDVAIKYIQKFKLKNMLDLCTGSGCIGISVAKNSNIENVLMTDISDSALEVAKQNIKQNKVEDRCFTLKSDLFSNIKDKKFDLLVSNPPYIKTDDILNLTADVRNEPDIALDGGEDGLKFYRLILSYCKAVLEDNAYLIMEIGYDQKDDFIDLVKSVNYIEYIDTLKDFSNNDRVVICRFHQI